MRGFFAVVFFLCCSFAVIPGCACGSTGNSGFADSDAGPAEAAPPVCKPTENSCGTVCVDTSNDVTHCGDCAIACDTGSQCCGGVCVGTAACAFSVTKVDIARLWRSGGQYVKLTGSGFVPKMRAMVGDGRAPLRVIDSSNALLLTPPGPLGNQDLTISVGPMKATLKNVVQYIDAGLTTPWQQKPMALVRGEDPGIAVLQDGRVLIAGGTTVPDNAALALDSAEIYTRSTDTVTMAAGKMSTPRWHSSAITLMNGKVLVVGAATATGATIADLFDPTTNTFTPTKGPLNLPRTYTRSVLLADGRVLVSSAGDASVEIYDPDLDAFTMLPHTQGHIYGFMVRLRDGRALLGGGDGTVTAAETFDPETNAFTSVGALKEGRSMLTAHTLPDGRVLIIGGSSISAGAIHLPLATMEAFDPTLNAFATLPYALTIGRTWHASALVRDGTVLVMGGYTVDNACTSLADSVDQVDPILGKVTVFAKLPNPNTEWTAVTLLDGSVLGVGGGACGAATAVPDIDFLPGAPVAK